MKVKRAIIEKLLQIRRSEEELPLLVREMRDHVLYYKHNVLPQLEATEDKMLEQIQDIASKLLIFFDKNDGIKTSVRLKITFLMKVYTKKLFGS